MQDTSQSERPYVFLFDSQAEGVPEPALAYFTAAVLAALSKADPHGQTRAHLRSGLPLLTSASERISAVRPGGFTRSHDMSVYKLLVWDWLDSTKLYWSSLDTEHATEIFRTHSYESVALSHLAAPVREAVDRSLRKTPGYVGAFELDPGNHIYRQAFWDGLLKLGHVVDGAVLQERSFEGDEDWPISGAATFKPGGLVWRPWCEPAPNAPPDLPQPTLSERGAITLARVTGKRAERVEHRVLAGLVRDYWRPRSSLSFEFELSQSGADVLEALMPEGKFTRYFFDPNSVKGAPKGRFFTEELGILPEDWRFLAAQFYEGLVRSELGDIELQSWEGGYGARFNVHLGITGRNGVVAVVRTGWMVEPGKPPKLSTALPDRVDFEIVTPGEPPIVAPDLTGPARWQQLFNLAHIAGAEAHMRAVPTPLFLDGWDVEPEGEVGSAWVILESPEPGLVQWVLSSNAGARAGKGRLRLRSGATSQSVDRARAYAIAFARVLILNGVSAQIEERLD